MKRLFAFAVVSFSLLSIGQAEEGSLLSLIVRWTPPGGEVVETKVPEVMYYPPSGCYIRLPVARGGDETGDPIWHAVFDFEVADGTVDITINDHSRLEPTKEHGPQPIEVFSARFRFKWNEEAVVWESPRGKLSFLVGGKAASNIPESPEPGTVTALESPEAFAKQLEASLKRMDGRLLVRLYNPTNRPTQSIHVRVIAPATGDLPGFDRVYKVPITCQSLSEGATAVGIDSFSEYPTEAPRQQRKPLPNEKPVETPQVPEFKITLEKAF